MKAVGCVKLKAHAYIGLMVTDTTLQQLTLIFHQKVYLTN